MSLASQAFPQRDPARPLPPADRASRPLLPAAATVLLLLEQDQAALGARVRDEGLNREQTVKAAEEIAAKKPGAGGPKTDKARGVGKNKTKPVTSRTLRTEVGVRLTAERAKGITDELLLAALEDGVRQIRAKLEPTEQGDETAAA